MFKKKNTIKKIKYDIEMITNPCFIKSTYNYLNLNYI